jgi:hypothetical protein
LRQAWHAVTDDPIGPWARSGRLLAALDRFRATIWSAWRTRPDPPEHASRLHTALFHICKAGRIPSTRRQIHAIAHEMCHGGFSAE